MATKNKTNRSIKKRFSVTATGKLKYKKSGKRHLLAGRTSKRKRQLRRAGVNDSPTAKTYLILLGEQ
jgi:large subunit ribosomal protein L35